MSGSHPVFHMLSAHREAVSVNSRVKTFYHIHLISDSTGETLNTVARAAAAHYERFHPIEHTYALVRTPKQLHRVLQEVEGNPGIVLFTLVDDGLRRELETRCRMLEVPCISVLDPVVATLATYLNAQSEPRIGAQHTLDSEYFRRIEALNYTMLHDDGQHAETLDAADVVLVGVSRTSKTPTSMYLANRGIKAANVPVVPKVPLPATLEEARHPLIVGLVASPERIAQIRRNRLISLNQDEETPYVDREAITEELVATRRLCGRNNWPLIDVTRRSIEETAAAILNLLSERQYERSAQ